MQKLFYDLSGGLNTSATKTDLGLDVKQVYWSDAVNVEIYKKRGITRQNGNQLEFNSPDNKAIHGIFGYEAGGKEIILFNCSDGSIYWYDRNLNTTTQINASLTKTTGVTYTRFLTGVVVSNGVDDPFFFEHKSPTVAKSCNAVSSNGVKIRGTAVSAYKGRLWIATGGTLYFSALGRYNDWTSAQDAGYISNFLSDIDEITALAPYKDYLAIYKSDNTFLLSGSSTSDFAIQRFADKGAMNQSCVLNVSNKQYFFNCSLFTLEQVGLLAQIGLGEDLSIPINSEFADFSYASPYRASAIHYEAKSQIWFFCPTIMDLHLKTVYIFDYQNGAWTKRLIPADITCAMSLNGRVFSATESGQVYLEDAGNSFDGKPISFLWKSPFFSLGEPNVRKTVEDFYFLFDENNNNRFDFSTYKDFDSEFEDDHMPVEVYDPTCIIWDTDLSLWGDENQGIIWSNNGDGVFKAQITQSNYAVQVSISGSDQTHNFALIGLEFKNICYDE